ncbi:MAG: ATP phosphoribosyltransferase regulatory subunit, partial [Parvularculaceae bacterium]
DVVGAPAPHADAEICAMFCAAIEASGVAREDFIIRVSDRQAMAGLLEVAGLAGDECREQRLITLRAMDKLDRLGEEGVRYLLGMGRNDESGDFTPGAKLTQTQADIVMAFMAATAGSNGDTCTALQDIIGTSEAGRAGIETLTQMAGTLEMLGFDEARIKIDSSIVRGLDYYTGPVFEADLTFEVLDEKDRPIQFGSIGGGGRYDDLVARFKGIQVPAVGCSIGVSRLLAALAARAGASEVPRGPVVVLALESDQMGCYQQMAAELRAADIRAEVYVGGSGMKAQMKYADKRNAPVTVICGEDERRAGEVTIKDLILGEQLSKQITDNKQWREDQPAQFVVKRDGLVKAVQETLARHSSVSPA